MKQVSCAVSLNSEAFGGWVQTAADGRRLYLINSTVLNKHGDLGVVRASCFSKGTAGQISALNDDPHSSRNLVQTLLKIGARCPGEEKQIPK